MLAQLLKRETEIDFLVESAAFAGVSAVRLAFEQGDTLREIKQHEQLNWDSWLADNFPKSKRTAWNYMKLATVPADEREQFLEDGKSIKHALTTVGLIPEQPKLLDVEPHVSIPPEIQKLIWIAEWLERDGEKIKAYTPNQRAELKTKLKPVIRSYESL